MVPKMMLWALLMLCVGAEAGVDDDAILERVKRELPMDHRHLGGSMFDTHSLLLVPIQDQQHPRAKREVGDSRKYHRLAHSVHVQSDIRYRLALFLRSSANFTMPP